VQIFLIVVIVAVVLVLVVVLMQRSRAGGQLDSAASPPETRGGGAGGGFRPPASDFHVEKGEARVTFDIPLPEGEPDPVLADILLREAVEVLRDKRATLPLEGVSTVHALAMRGGVAVEVGSLTLDGPGELPPPPPPGEHPLAHKGADIFAEFGGGPPEVPGTDVRTPADELTPVGEDLQLTARMEAGLRMQGIDPTTAPTSTLVPALLRLAGYEVMGEGLRLTATKAGDRSYVEIVDHSAGDHPELAERAVNEFLVHFGQSGATTGMLFTAKYGPFMIYDKERREQRVRFVTRERFQSFVNAVSL
jgi:hypothetical protein